MVGARKQQGRKGQSLFVLIKSVVYVTVQRRLSG